MLKNASEVFTAFITRPITVLMMEAVSSCETSGNFCKTTRRNFPEDKYFPERFVWKEMRTGL
jgi:hypothetical protein